jgi:predicted AlkP superfamily phosphohydrolase/phosphomutase
MLSNAVLAGAVAAAYVAALVLHLNPAIRLDDPAAWPLVGAVLLVYGVHLAVVFYAVIVARQVLSTEGVSPGWLSYRVLAWFCAAASTAAAALMWQNLWGFSAALDPVATSHFFVAAVTMTTCAAGCVVLGVFRLWADRPGRLAAIAFGLVMLASIALPLATRGVGDSSRLETRRLETSPVVAPDTGAGRVVLLAVDAASLDFISPAVADGRLPNFGRLLDAGASMHLATLRPTQPGPVWTAVATGKLPWRNGVRSAATYRAVAGGAAADLLPDFCFAHALVSFGLLTETLQTSAALLAQPVWTILGRAGLQSTIVRWPLTWPAQPLAGALISDEFHRASEIALALDEPGLTYPPELASRLARVGHPSVNSSPQALEPEHPAVGATPLALDRFYVALADAVAAETPVRFTALRLQGLDIVGHYFLRYAMPQAFGDVSEDERGRFGRVFEQYYAYVDAELGRLLDRLQPGDLLLVVSPFGLEPLSLPKRLLERTMGNPNISGTHERAPDGFLLAYGTAVKPGRYPRGSVVDVTPTLLYYYGLPIGRDMDGYARTDIFTTAFSAERPIAFIPTYER